MATRPFLKSSFKNNSGLSNAMRHRDADYDPNCTINRYFAYGYLFEDGSGVLRTGRHDESGVDTNVKFTFLTEAQMEALDDDYREAFPSGSQQYFALMAAAE
jgi:hypothetical protein